MGILNSSSVGALNATFDTTNIANLATTGVVVSGTWIGTLTFQGSLNGTDFFDILALPAQDGKISSTTAVNGSFYVNSGGLTSVRLKMTAYSSGSATVITYGTGPSVFDRQISTLVGNTDGTRIGNVGERLKTDTDFSGNALANSAAFTSKTRVIVLTSTINLASGSYTNCYTYSGSGLLYGFNVEFNNASIIVRLQVDGEIIFDGVTISTLNGLLGTGNDAARRQAGTGIVTSSATIDWSLKQPIKYSSSVTISADANGGVLFSRTFTQGIVYLSKET